MILCDLLISGDRAFPTAVALRRLGRGAYEAKVSLLALASVGRARNRASVAAQLRVAAFANALEH